MIINSVLGHKKIKLQIHAHKHVLRAKGIFVSLSRDVPVVLKNKEHSWYSAELYGFLIYGCNCILVNLILF